MTYQIVYNNCYGGFGLSAKALKRLRELEPDNKSYGPGNWDNTLQGEALRDSSICNYDCESFLPNISRHNKNLIKVVKELGKEASGHCAKLTIHTQYTPYYLIHEYDGNESVEEFSFSNSIIDARV